MDQDLVSPPHSLHYPPVFENTAKNLQLVQLYNDNQDILEDFHTVNFLYCSIIESKFGV